ncbi:MAG: hypothetical protein ACOC5E_01225 [Acidobacteriota bacterium]
MTIGDQGIIHPGLFPITEPTVLAALIMVLSGCLSVQQGYRSSDGGRSSERVR